MPPTTQERIAALRERGVSVGEIARRADAETSDVFRFLRTTPERRPLEPRLADACTSLESETVRRKSRKTKG